MTPREKGLKRGYETAASSKNWLQTMQSQFDRWRILYPTAVEMDFGAAILELDRQRLQDEPSLTQFPELRGHMDLLRAEREAFMLASGLDQTAAAFAFSGDFFMRRRLDTRHLARYDLLPPPTACTGVFFPETKEGGPVFAQNIDVGLIPKGYEFPSVQSKLATDWLGLNIGGGSCAVLLDDEPKCSFPADPNVYPLMPDEVLDDIEEIVKFLGRFNEFWGPGNGIYVDRQWRGVVIEKSNCLMAVRRPVVNGACCATACAYLDPKMGEHQLARARKAMALKGQTEENSEDVQFHLGAGRRYRRLIELVASHAQAGPTLEGALEVVSDHAVPYPERVCLAGECTFPDREKVTNWTVWQYALVTSGPNRRCLSRQIDAGLNPKPVYEQTPKLTLRPGVKMKKKWQEQVDAGKWEMA